MAPKQQAPVQVSVLVPASIVSRAVKLQDWVERTGSYATLTGAMPSMGHIYRLALVRGLESLEAEKEKKQ